MEDVKNKLRDLMKDHNVGGHNIEHMIAVMNHAKKAVEQEILPQYIKEKIILAALLHDADDTKIFKHSKHFNNARTILKESLSEDFLRPLMDEEMDVTKFWFYYDGNILLYRDFFIDDVIELIELVSCSKDGNSDPPQRWMAIPRDCDRLEAIGEIGIKRCDEYSAATNAPDFTPETHRVSTEKELWSVATPERFSKYKKSVSKIDHYYDKLLHIGKPECLKSQNKYILEEASRRRDIMVQYVLDFWKCH